MKYILLAALAFALFARCSNGYPDEDNRMRDTATVVHDSTARDTVTARP